MKLTTAQRKQFEAARNDRREKLTEENADGGLDRCLARLMGNQRLNGPDYRRLTFALQYALADIALRDHDDAVFSEQMSAVTGNDEDDLVDDGESDCA